MKEERLPLKQESLGERLPMRAIINFLKTQEISPDFNPEKNFYEFELEGEVSADELRELLSLPYEVALTEKDGKLILSTGTKDYASSGPGYTDRSINSRLSFHTHYVEEGNRTPDVPSFSDLYVTDFSVKKENPFYVLASAEGLKVYQKPHIRKDKELDTSARWLITEFCNDKWIDFTGLLGGSRTRWEDVSKKRRVELEEEFARNSGVIVREALWNDERGVAEIMEIINLKTAKSGAK